MVFAHQVGEHKLLVPTSGKIMYLYLLVIALTAMMVLPGYCIKYSLYRYEECVKYYCIKCQTWIVYSSSECCLLEPKNEDSCIDRKFKCEQVMITVMEGNDE